MKKVPFLNFFEPKPVVSSQSVVNSPSPGSIGDGDFGFAFDDPNFSDRVLRIEIMDGAEVKEGGDGCMNVADWVGNRKRRREEIKKENATELTLYSEEHILNCNQHNAEEHGPYENEDDEAVALIAESNSVDETLHRKDSLLLSTNLSTVVRVETIHISSPILAARSPFFYKLFSNGTRETEQRCVTLRINASEEIALMELLRFMYSTALTATTAPALLDVMMAADKYKVASCMRYCSRALCDLPMTPDSALMYLELPSHILMNEAVKPLTDAAKQFLATRYKDLTKLQDEVSNLPLVGIEAIFISDDLQVASEDAVCDFILKWVRTHYPNTEERRKVLTKRLARLIRFPFMTCRKLKKVLGCTDFDHDVITKLVLDALIFKAEPAHKQRILAAEYPHKQPGSATQDPKLSSRFFVERAYKYRPVKVVEFELPRPQCVVYLDLKRADCVKLFPLGRVYSQAFHLGGQGFFLSAHCNMDQHGQFSCFGLFLGMQERGTVSFSVEYEFAARSKPTEEYLSKYRGSYTFTGGKAVGYRNLFGLPWRAFVAEDSPYFINDILHLRAELTVKH